MAGSICHPYCTEMSFVTYSSACLTSLHQQLFIDTLTSLHQQLFISTLTSSHLCTVCTHLIHLYICKSSVQELLPTNVFFHMYSEQKRLDSPPFMMGPCPNHIVFAWMVQVPCTNKPKPLKLHFDITATVTHFRIMIFTHLCCESLAQMHI